MKNLWKSSSSRLRIGIRKVFAEIVPLCSSNASFNSRLVGKRIKIKFAKNIYLRRPECTRFVQRGVSRWIGGTFRISKALFHKVFNRTVENFYAAFIFVVHSAGGLALKLLSAASANIFPIAMNFQNHSILLHSDFRRAMSTPRGLDRLASACVLLSASS